jgi:hypothetical protein
MPREEVREQVSDIGWWVARVDASRAASRNHRGEMGVVTSTTTRRIVSILLPNRRGPRLQISKSRILATWLAHEIFQGGQQLG